jgi:GntR family transcriptional repressor for pyruvate dehydrogenase complex
MEQIEEMIFSGELKAGERLPTERELAVKMNVSQTVVNNGLSKLAERGLLRIAPRKGTFVADYMNEGGLETLASLVKYSKNHLPSELMRSMYEFRLYIERTFFHMATEKMVSADYEKLEGYLDELINSSDVSTKTEVAYEAVRYISQKSENEIYIMVINGFKSLYYAVFEKFFSVADINEAVRYVRRIIKCMAKSDFVGLDKALGNYQAYEFDTLERNKFFKKNG